MPEPWDTICSHITSTTGDPVSPQGQSTIGGGCINQAFRLHGSTQDYFVKLNHADRVGMFTAEALGLQEIAKTGTVRVPQPLCHGTQGNNAYLVLEYLELSGSSDMEVLGDGLAAMHQNTKNQFGWEIDNTIGSTAQHNSWSDDWVSFWQEYRLGFQLALAASNGHGGRLQQRGELLLISFASLFEPYTPQASLLHGDLWSGNYAGLAGGEPVIFDPATYYGDREADLAMTELFGGFGKRFYQAYENSWPLDSGYSVRKTLYNLYHILNHLNLFGGSYLSQAEGMIDRLLSEVR